MQSFAKLLFLQKLNSYWIFKEKNEKKKSLALPHKESETKLFLSESRPRVVMHKYIKCKCK